MAEAGVRIAGLRTALVTQDDDVATLIEERYQGFLSSGPADWRLGIACGPAPQASSGGGGVVVQRDGTRPRFTVGRHDIAATVDVSRRTADARLAEADDVALNSVLRVLYSLALVDARGLVVHAAGLVRDERAYLFCGRSGSGKTTVSRLSAHATLLSDELCIVRTVGGVTRCFGSPFRGELGLAGTDGGQPLAGIYFLRQAAEHAVAPVTPADALRRLLPNVLFFVRDGDVTARVFDIATALVEAVPCYELAFRRDPGFWEVIEHG